MPERPKQKEVKKDNNTQDDKRDEGSQASKVDGDTVRQVRTLQPCLFFSSDSELMQDVERVDFSQPLTPEARRKIGWQERT